VDDTSSCNELDDVRTAAWALIGAAIPRECVQGVSANLQILAGHVAVVRSAGALETTEAAEVFRA